MPIEEEWAGRARTDDADFAEWLVDLSLAARAGEIALSFPPHRPPDIREPGAWNLVGDAAFAEAYPLSWDYLDERSPNFALKRFERQLYLKRLEPWLESLPAGAAAIDIGGGIGRFAGEWLKRGFDTTLADANGAALTVALGHLARSQGRYRLLHLAAEDLSPLENGHFYLASAMEVFCYLSDPAEGMREAARVLRPGGLLVCSVESGVGSLDPAQRNDRGAIEEALKRSELSVEGDMWVRYFTADSLRDALTGAGLEVEAIMGTHYLPDGPMHRLVDFDRLGDPDYDAALLKLEEELAGSEKWRDAARAWVAVARKPGLSRD